MNKKLSEAITLQQKGNWPQALNIYQKILQENPNHETALVNLGIILFQNQEIEKGLHTLEKAVNIHSHSANAHFNFGYALMTVKIYQKALFHFNKVIDFQPNTFVAYLHLGKIYYFLGQEEASFKSFERAYQLNPKSLELLNNWANTCISLERFEQGLKILEKALQDYPNQWELYGNKATIYQKQWKLPQAEEAFKKAISLNQNDWQLYHGLGAVYHHWNKKKQALNCLEKALALNPNNSKLYSDYIYHLNYYPDLSDQSLFNLHKNWGNKFGNAGQDYLFNSYNNQSSNTLKVGLMSADFCYHPVAIFLLGWLSKINVSNIQFYAYAQIRKRDSYTKKFQSMCQWYEMNGKSDLEIAKHIHQDGINILIDLTGHTAGNRLGVMAFKPAPILASYLGYINTTGLTQIDYRIVDQFVNPPKTQKYYTEKLVYLPDSYTCYHPPETSVTVQPPPVLKNGFITFGCYNNPAKLNEKVVKLWAQVMKLVPNSKLRLKARHFCDAQSIAPIVEMFEVEGINNNRLIFEGISVLHHYFEAYHQVDIALDPFPHNGGTTTHDTLYMGVPVITLEGKSYVSRMGVSILNNLGHPEWIAKNESAFIDVAINLSSNIEQLQKIRENLRIEFLESSLCDGEKFAKNMENLLLNLWTNRLS